MSFDFPDLATVPAPTGRGCEFCDGPPDLDYSGTDVCYRCHRQLVYIRLDLDIVRELLLGRRFPGQSSYERALAIHAERMAGRPL